MFAVVILLALMALAALAASWGSITDSSAVDTAKSATAVDSRAA